MLKLLAGGLCMSRVSHCLARGEGPVPLCWMSWVSGWMSHGWQKGQRLEKSSRWLDLCAQPVTAQVRKEPLLRCMEQSSPHSTARAQLSSLSSNRNYRGKKVIRTFAVEAESFAWPQKASWGPGIDQFCKEGCERDWRDWKWENGK